MRKFIIKVFINILGLYIAGLFFPAIAISSLAAAFWTGLILGLVNLLIRPLLLIISFPINLVTLGLFTLVLNAWMVMLAAHFASGVFIPSFMLFLATALIISALNIVFDCFK